MATNINTASTNTLPTNPQPTAIFVLREKHESNPCQFIDLEAQTPLSSPADEKADLRSPSPIYNPPSKSLTQVKMPSHPGFSYALQTSRAHARFAVFRGLNFVGKCINTLCYLLCVFLGVCVPFGILAALIVIPILTVSRFNDFLRTFQFDVSVK